MDPRPAVYNSIYSAMNNNPVLYSDMFGDTIKFAGATETNAYADFKSKVLR